MRKPEGKITLRKGIHRCVDNIKMDLVKNMIGWCGLDESGSRERQVDSSCELGNEHSRSVRCSEVIKWLHNWWPLEKFPAPYRAS
jgi:hypothetical protein